MTETSARELLTDVHLLRRRARWDRRASAFPLFLFGGLILLAPLCYVPAEPVPPDVQGVILYTTQSGPFPVFFGLGPYLGVKYPGLIGWYWFLAIVGGFAATAWWYRRHARRVGVETDTRAYLVAAGAALTGFLIGVPLLEFLVPARHTLYSTPGTNLPILFGSAVAAGVALLWARGQTRTAPRAAGLFTGVLLATITFASVGVYLIYGFAALLIVAAALLVLAWQERNLLLAGVGVVFGGAALLVNLANVNNLFFRLGWHPEDLRPLVLQQVLLPAVILLAGGVVTVLAGRTAAR